MMGWEARLKCIQVLLLMFLVQSLFWSLTGGTGECEVTDVSVTSDKENSTFSFHLTYRNTWCSSDQARNLKIRLESCDGNPQQFMLNPSTEGWVLPSLLAGTWKVTVAMPDDERGSWRTDSIHSPCFRSIGMSLYPNMAMSFTHNELEILIHHNDSRLSGWTLDTYEHKKNGETDACSSRDLHDMDKKFRLNPSLQPESVGPKHIKIIHDFDPDGCYCFVLKVVSEYPLRPHSRAISTPTCRPQKMSLSGNGPALMGVLPLSPGEAAAVGLVGGVLLLCSVVGVSRLLVGVLCRPTYLSSLLGLRRHQADGKKEATLGQSLLKQQREVLLLYAREECVQTNNLAKLKKLLRADFKVYDIHNWDGDPEWLGDPAGWLSRVLMRGSGVKVVLVEGAKMKEHVQALLLHVSTTTPFSTENSNSNSNTSPASSTPTSPACVGGNGLLTFALRQILCTELRHDYTTLFVVRFSDARWQETQHMEDGVDLVVKMKRYNLHCHYDKLREDILR